MFKISKGTYLSRGEILETVILWGKRLRSKCSWITEDTCWIPQNSPPGAQLHNRNQTAQSGTLEITSSWLQDSSLGSRTAALQKPALDRLVRESKTLCHGMGLRSIWENPAQKKGQRRARPLQRGQNFLSVQRLGPTIGVIKSTSASPHRRAEFVPQEGGPEWNQARS